VTQIPIVTMPNGDMTHPIPDLTGYVTEGQIALDRDLERRGIYPPVSVLASLSRLMPDGIGPGRTRNDHAEISRRLYAACARAARARDLAAIIGREELSSSERAALAYAEGFERRFLSQGRRERRTIGETLDRGREALAILAGEAAPR
jgi:V/A-type H+-transporting ATPase subunit B